MTDDTLSINEQLGAELVKAEKTAESRKLDFWARVERKANRGTEGPNADKHLSKADGKGYLGGRGEASVVKPKQFGLVDKHRKYITQFLKDENAGLSIEELAAKLGLPAGYIYSACEHKGMQDAVMSILANRLFSFDLIGLYDSLRKEWLKGNVKAAELAIKLLAPAKLGAPKKKGGLDEDEGEEENGEEEVLDASSQDEDYSKATDEQLEYIRSSKRTPDKEMLDKLMRDENDAGDDQGQ